MASTLFEATPYRLKYSKGTFDVPTATDKYSVYGSSDYTIFGQEYFAGANVSIYFGDILVDEVVAMQLALQEQHLPVYGYGSYTYDAVAKGNRIIQGSFGIYYKEEGYIPLLMNQLNNEQQTKTVKTDPFKYQVSPEEATLESLLDKLYSKNGGFEAYANAYEEVLWGSQSSKNITAGEMSNRSFDSYFTPSTYADLKENGFRIVIAFGPEARMRNSSGVLKDTAQVPTTIRTVHGVHLTSSRMVIANSGEPLYEEYDFIARDFDAPNSNNLITNY